MQAIEFSAWASRPPRLPKGLGSGMQVPSFWLATIRQLRAVILGRRAYQSVACSYAWASRKTAASPPKGPLTCRPIGSPDPVNPHGIEMVGQPYTSNGDVLCIVRVCFSMDVLTSVLNSAMVGGGTRVVGVTIASTV